MINPEKLKQTRHLTQQIRAPSSREFQQNVTRKQLAIELENLALPKHTHMRLLANTPDQAAVEWENLLGQHCITLKVNLKRCTADYEYSTVCKEQEEMRPFPSRPLNSTQVERIDLNINYRTTWRWLQARLKATAKFSR